MLTATVIVPVKCYQNGMIPTQLTFTYLKSTMITLEKGAKYVQI